MYWFDGALKGKLEGGHAKCFRDNPKPPPPLPIKNEQSLISRTSLKNLVVEMKNGATKLGNINYICMAFEFRPLHVLEFI